MTRKEFFDRTLAALAACYEAGEARMMALILLEEFLGWQPADLFTNPVAVVSPDEAPALGQVERALTEIAAYRPLQYVLGKAWFGRRSFAVDENVLIPRPETEELVRRVVDEQRGRTPRILDIGTGSGCIAVSLALDLPGARVTAVDVSPGALAVARANGRAHGAEVAFVLCDILSESPAGPYEVIVSNPPYVLDRERAAMRPHVLEHEPSLALFVPDDDPLRFYRRIADYGTQVLTAGGKLYFEINEAMGEAIATLLSEKEYDDICIIHDIFDRPRMATGVWNGK